MIDGVDFIIDEYGRDIVEMEEVYDEEDNKHLLWKDTAGEWHDDIVDAVADRDVEYYDDEYSDPYDD